MALKIFNGYSGNILIEHYTIENGIVIMNMSLSWSKSLSILFTYIIFSFHNFNFISTFIQ